MGTRLWLSLGLLTSASCGGGNVDHGFYGDYAATPPAAAHRSVAPRVAEPAAETEDASFRRPKLVVIRAAWCRFCRAAEPSIMSAYEPFRGKIDLVVLDVTDDDAKERSASVAASEGLSAFFAKYGGRTPSVGVFVAPEQGRLVHGDVGDPDVLTRELEFSITRFKRE